MSETLYDVLWELLFYAINLNKLCWFSLLLFSTLATKHFPGFHNSFWSINFWPWLSRFYTFSGLFPGLKKNHNFKFHVSRVEIRKSQTDFIKVCLVNDLLNIIKHDRMLTSFQTSWHSWAENKSKEIHTLSKAAKRTCACPVTSVTENKMRDNSE